MENKAIQTNKSTWDAVAPKYFGRTALPQWGVFAVGQDDGSLIGDIDGKTFLEIACGSGHSIEYLIHHGASSVYGLDFSHTQIELAARTNSQAIQQGKVVLFEHPMEERISLPEPVDMVFSIYGLGWATDIDRVLQNVNAYLAVGGRFVWSWEHPIYSKVDYMHDQFVVTQSYHDEDIRREESWGSADGRFIATRKVSTWYNSLRANGFEVVRMVEPAPDEFTEPEQNPAKYYSAPKANLVPATMIFDCKKIADAD